MNKHKKAHIARALATLGFFIQIYSLITTAITTILLPFVMSGALQMEWYIIIWLVIYNLISIEFILTNSKSEQILDVIKGAVDTVPYWIANKILFLSELSKMGINVSRQLNANVNYRDEYDAEFKVFKQKEMNFSKRLVLTAISVLAVSIVANIITLFVAQSNPTLLGFLKIVDTVAFTSAGVYFISQTYSIIVRR